MARSRRVGTAKRVLDNTRHAVVYPRKCAKKSPKSDLWRRLSPDFGRQLVCEPRWRGGRLLLSVIYCGAVRPPAVEMKLGWRRCGLDSSGVKQCRTVLESSLCCWMQAAVVQWAVVGRRGAERRRRAHPKLPNSSSGGSRHESHALCSWKIHRVVRPSQLVLTTRDLSGHGEHRQDVAAERRGLYASFLEGLHFERSKAASSLTLCLKMICEQ